MIDEQTSFDLLNLMEDITSDIIDEGEIMPTMIPKLKKVRKMIREIIKEHLPVDINPT